MTEVQKRYHTAVKKLEDDLGALANARGIAARDARKAKQSAAAVERARAKVLLAQREQISADCALRAEGRAVTR